MIRNIILALLCTIVGAFGVVLVLNTVFRSHGKKYGPRPPRDEDLDEKS